jgi:hypothetical protein
MFRIQLTGSENGETSAVAQRALARYFGRQRFVFGVRT